MRLKPSPALSQNQHVDYQTPSLQVKRNQRQILRGRKDGCHCLAVAGPCLFFFHRSIDVIPSEPPHSKHLCLQPEKVLENRSILPAGRQKNFDGQVAYVILQIARRDWSPVIPKRDVFVVPVLYYVSVYIAQMLALFGILPEQGYISRLSGCGIRGEGEPHKFAGYKRLWLA